MDSDSSFSSNNEDIDDEHINPLDNSDDENETFINPNEEENILEELEEMELGKLVQAKTRLENEKKLNLKKGKINKRQIESKLLEINQEKRKNEPREFSALIKPKKNFLSDLNQEKAIKRDPRFDSMSGDLKMDSYKKNFSFVQNKANDYIKNIRDLQKKKEKKKIKLDDEEYNLMKKQINFVKGWIKSKEHEGVKDTVAKEFKDENKERKSKGLNPVYVKPSVMKKLVQKTQIESRSEKDNKKYLKRKQHRDVVQLKKNDISKINKY